MAAAVMAATPKDGPLTAKLIKRALEGYWADKMALVWNADDMHTAANQAGRALTKAEAAEALHEICRNHDADNGVTWETLNFCAGEAGRPLTPAERAQREEDEDALIVAE